MIQLLLIYISLFYSFDFLVVFVKRLWACFPSLDAANMSNNTSNAVTQLDYVSDKQEKAEKPSLDVGVEIINITHANFRDRIRILNKIELRINQVFSNQCDILKKALEVINKLKTDIKQLSIDVFAEINSCFFRLNNFVSKNYGKRSTGTHTYNLMLTIFKTYFLYLFITKRQKDRS